MNEAIRLLYSMIEDPKFHFNYHHKHRRHTIGKDAKVWTIMQPHHDSMMCLKFTNRLCIASGRDCSKSTSLTQLIHQVALLHPDQDSGYIVMNQRHANKMLNVLEKSINNDPIAKAFLAGYDKKERMFTFKNGHTFSVRITGHDKTGEKTLISLHTHFLIVDEAQILNRVLLEQLLHCIEEGGVLIFAGVPDNSRDSILFVGCSNDEYTYIKYSSEESHNWDADKEKTYIKQFGGKESITYRNQVHGEWADSANSTFRSSKLYDSIIECNFKYKTSREELFLKIKPNLNLPELQKKYERYIIGLDVGYTENSPAHLCVLGNYQLPDTSGIKDKVDHYDLIYRLQLSNMKVHELAKLLDYLITYFNSTNIAIDAQNLGAQLFDMMCKRELFPETAVRNKKYTQQVMFGEIIVYRIIEQYNEEAQKFENVEQKYIQKICGTNKLNDLLEDGRFHLSVDDANGNVSDDDDIMKILQADITINNSANRYTPVKFENHVNPHCVDALRCCALNIFKTIESGIRLNNIAPSIAPVRIKNSVFNRGNKPKNNNNNNPRRY